MAGDGDDGGTRTVTKTVTPSGICQRYNFPNILKTVTHSPAQYAKYVSIYRLWICF